MGKVSNVGKKLIQYLFALTVIALSVTYLCSFMWHKLGLSPSYTIFGRAFISSAVDIEKHSIKEGDLVIAKEYLNDSSPEENDFVLYLHDGSLDLGLIKSSSINEVGASLYHITSSFGNNLKTIRRGDIIGEVSMIFDGAGNIGVFLSSPAFLAVIYLIIFIGIILCKLFKKRKYIENEILEASGDNVIATNDNDTTDNDVKVCVTEGESSDEEVEAQADVSEENGDAINEEIPVEINSEEINEADVIVINNAEAIATALVNELVSEINTNAEEGLNVHAPEVDVVSSEMVDTDTTRTEQPTIEEDALDDTKEYEVNIVSKINDGAEDISKDEILIDDVEYVKACDIPVNNEAKKSKKASNKQKNKKKNKSTSKNKKKGKNKKKKKK